MNPSHAPRRYLPLAVTSTGLLAWSNVVVPRLPAGDGTRTAAGVAAVAVLVGLARAAGLSWHHLGLDRRSWRTGAWWGAAVFAAVAAGYGLALAVPPLRVLLEDPRLEGSATGPLVLRGLLQIPLGTVLTEEVAFRGVLLATALRALPTRPALAVAGAVFGLWHVSSARLPAVPTASPALQAGSVVGVVVFTSAAGVVLSWLRLRSGSLLAPVGLHLGTNSVGLLAAAAATRYSTTF